MGQFTDVKNVRIKSLTPGAVVQLRIGKAPATSKDDDVTVIATVISHDIEGDKSLVNLEEVNADGVKSPLTISKFPGASWRAGSQYVSLKGIDESTFSVPRSASSVAASAFDDAIRLITKEADDVYAPDLLISLLAGIKDGKRVPKAIKDLANRFAVRLSDELSELEAKRAE